MVPIRLPKRFELIRELGRGGMGAVYEAIDAEGGARVAIKTLPTRDAIAIARFKQEFRALADLHHPNLVSLGELFCEDGEWAFSMDLVPGNDIIEALRPEARPHDIPSSSDDDTRSLEAVAAVALAESELGSRPPPSSRHRAPFADLVADEQQLRDAFAQLAAGIGALHEAGKVHRDIKPSNVRVRPDGHVVVLDFGLVTELATTGALTGEHATIGTPAYMAPEQAASSEIGTAADWYSVGVVLFEALTGRLPFQGTPLQMMMAKQTDAVPSPSAFASDIPPDLDKLCAALLRFDPSKRPLLDDVLRRLKSMSRSRLLVHTTTRATFSSTFVGREAELARLDEAFAKVLAGGSQTVVLSGVSGIGKSALAQHFVQVARTVHPDLVVLSGRCFERESIPFKAVDGLVDAVGRWMARLPEPTADALLPTAPAILARVFSTLTHVPAFAKAASSASRTRLDPREERTRLFAAVRELFARIGSRYKVVLLLDDIQWSDADGLAVLSEILRPPEAPRVLLLATARVGADGAASPPETHLMKIEGADRIVLGPLSIEEADRLTRSLLSRTPGSSIDPRTVAEESGGHPLFIDELVRHAQTPGGGALKLDSALSDRAFGLGKDARRLLDVVVVEGAPLRREIAVRAAGLEAPVYMQCVAELKVARLVHGSNADGVDEVMPYHDRVREALIAKIPKEAQVRIHRDLALAYEHAHPDAERLAIHWEAAGDIEAAARHAEQAGDNAAKGLAFDRAAGWYRRSLDLGGMGRQDLQRKLGEALVNAGRGADAAEAFLEAARNAPPAQSLDYRRRAAEHFLVSGHVDRGLETSREVLAAIGMSLAKTPITALLSVIFFRLIVTMRGTRFRLRHAEELSPQSLARIDICRSVATGLGNVDNIRGSAFNSRAFLMALKLGEVSRLATTMGQEAAYISISGGPARAKTLKLLATTRSLVEKWGDPFGFAWHRTGAAIGLYYVGEFEEALKHARAASAGFRDDCHDNGWALATAHLYEMFSLFHTGRIRELSVRAPELVAEAKRRGDRYCATNLSLSRVNVAWLVDGDVRRAQAIADEAVAGWSLRGFQIQHWFAATARINRLLYEGRGTEAQAEVVALLPPLRSAMLMRVQLVRIEAMEMAARSAIAIASLGGAQAKPSLARAAWAARKIEREKMAWSNPLAQAIRAAIALHRGERDRGVGLLEQAAMGFDTAGMRQHAAAARWNRGLTLGGAVGASEMAAADAWMQEEGIREPANWVRMIAPSVPSSRENPSKG